VLIYLTAALHVILFNLSLGLDVPTEQQLQHVKRALTNWKAVWNRRLSIDRLERSPIASFDIPIEPEGEDQASRAQYGHQRASNTFFDSGSLGHNNNKDDWRRAGFWRHASEYWLLARLFLEQFESAERGIQAVEGLSGPGGSTCQNETKILSRYDETDMTALHKFLSSCVRVV
jgi:hypothetical protein